MVHRTSWTVKGSIIGIVLAGTWLVSGCGVSGIFTQENLNGLWIGEISDNGAPPVKYQFDCDGAGLYTWGIASGKVTISPTGQVEFTVKVGPETNTLIGQMSDNGTEIVMTTRQYTGSPLGDGSVPFTGTLTKYLRPTATPTPTP